MSELFGIPSFVLKDVVKWHEDRDKAYIIVKQLNDIYARLKSYKTEELTTIERELIELVERNS